MDNGSQRVAAAATAMIPSIVRNRSMRKSSQRAEPTAETTAIVPDKTSPPKRAASTKDTRRLSARPDPTRTNSRTARQPTREDVARPVVKKRTTITAQTGSWALGKTIGAGSMGKVKIAKNMQTGEQVAVKIIPRQSTDEHRSEREKERADHSKEIRTAREAAIVTLLNHPYICAMRDVQRTGYHWYMLFEYVNGGQMLDYIISHGKLKEKQARKFGRQIASALDYCHRNSIVHRDLKIENILISKLGDIKIIDFGLSNLYSPHSHLKTFCGSLYFAAPELLQARQYTGPEVDVWSFGIVLYVLVCGKVPFDDQSMPQLHAKIKRGVVEYPSWLSQEKTTDRECKHLISRMLVTDPRQRATLADILTHPWLNKGYNGPPDNFLPLREPLQLPLDPKVIDKMTGFDFGSADFITRELTRVLSSDEYQSALRSSLKDEVACSPGQERRRGVFDFYKRRSSFTQRDLTANNCSADGLQLGIDPVNAFSPLISIYYLVREKQEREHVELNPGALAMPADTDESLLQPASVEVLSPPQAAHTNVAAFEMAGEKPTGGRARARSRTQGEEDFKPRVQDLKSRPPYEEDSKPLEDIKAPSKRESSGLGLLRRFSTRRGNRPDLAPPAVQQPSAPHRTFSMRKPRPRTSMLHAGGSTPHREELLNPASINAMSRSASANSVSARRVDHASASSIVPEEVAQSVETVKPVYLKGLFSVSTTSNKPLPQIRADIIRVLDELGVTYHEVKGGFACRHGLSVEVPQPKSPQNLDVRRRISFVGGKLEEGERKPVDKRLTSRKRMTMPDTSFTASSESESDVTRTTPRLREPERNLQVPQQDMEALRMSEPLSPTVTKRGPGEGSDFAGAGVGETTTHVQNDAGTGMVLKFEIFLVKVPLFSLHGIQFKKVQGGTWQYKEMASRILDALSL